MSLPIAFRAAVPADLGLVYSSWLKSYWDARPMALAHVARALFFSDSGHHGVIDRLLPRSTVTVAHPPGDPDEIYGWLCSSERALHYLYVKELWRRKGVARGLLAFAEYGPAIRCSHLTSAFLEALGRECDCQYDPYAMMEAA